MKKPLVIVICFIAVCITIQGEATTLRYGRNTSVRQTDVVIKKFSSLGSLSPGQLGDINGDGYDDFAIADWRWDSPEGPRVGIFFGKPQWAHDLNLTQADVLLDRGNGPGMLGYRFPLYPGDVNGDGYDDMIITNQGNRTYFIYGRKDFPRGAMSIETLADVTITEGYLGYGSEFIGDFNGDGHDDFVLWEEGWPAECFIVPGRGARYASWADMRLMAWNWEIGEGVEYYVDIDSNLDGRDDFSATGDRGFRCTVFGRQAQLPKEFQADIVNWNNDQDTECIMYLYHFSFDGPATSLDLNGDGLVDTIIGDENPDAPKIGSGRVNISPGQTSYPDHEADFNSLAFFVGEHPNAGLGIRVTYAGDVDSNGYEDILFSGNTTAGTGKVYCALGGPGKWADKNMPVTLAEMSFVGAHRLLGNWLANVGDVNGDAIDDWCLGGKEEAYLVFPTLNERPFPIRAIRTYHDKNFTIPTRRPYKIWERLYMEVEAEDKDPSTRNVCEVVLKSQGYTNPRGLMVRCKETGDNTGRFRGEALLSDTGANRFWHRLRVLRHDTVTITSWEDRNVTASVQVADVTPTPSPTLTPTKTPTLTPTPTPPPYILLAGYWDTRLTSSSGGTLTMVALLGNLVNSDGCPEWWCYDLDVYFGGQKTEIRLDDALGPFPERFDRVWGRTTSIQPPLPPGHFSLELALSRLSNPVPVTGLWPYLEVKP